jgi:TnpA family transposase
MYSHFLLLECVVMANQKIPSYLNAEQRQELMEIPSDLSERDLARYYSFTQEELKLINSRRRPENRFGFAVQLALLRFPGRPLAEYHGDFRQVPHSILKTISHQIELPVSTYKEYGQRISTLYEHIEDICKECGYRRCGWKEYLGAARSLLLPAMESDRAIPLIEAALEYFPSEKILPPTLVQIEKLVWVVLKLAERRLHALLIHRLTSEQKQQLDGLLMSEQRRGGRSRLSWLRQPPGEASPKSVTKIVERIFAIRDLELPLFQQNSIRIASSSLLENVQSMRRHPYSEWPPRVATVY